MIIGANIIEGQVLAALRALQADLYFVLVDGRVAAEHRARLEPLFDLAGERRVLSMEGGEQAKDVDTLTTVWRWLAGECASRQSALVVVGGGSLCDVAGLAAAMYMRGIRVVNLPTTLLAMVDASVGGKTAIDFGGVKNLIGAFHPAAEVAVEIEFLSTLPIDELYSGYAEVIKTAMLAHEGFWRRILAIGDPQGLNSEDWTELIKACIDYKASVVALDPEERAGVRQRLNFGHTVGHALEALSHQTGRRPLLHGEAVTIGLVVETYLGVKYLGTSRELLRQLIGLLGELYPRYSYTCRDYPQLLELMQLDKKNRGGELCFYVPRSIGQVEEIRLKDPKPVEEALDFYRETFGV